MSPIDDRAAARKTRTFTGMKLDLLKCIAFDRKMTPYDVEVALIILSHVNEKTGVAILSDEAIADLTGSGGVRNVYTSRRRLREGRWLTWRRTRKGPNVYRPLYDRLNGMLDAILVANEARKEARERRLDTHHSADQEILDTHHSADGDTHYSADKHLRGTPSEKRVTEEVSKSTPRQFSANGSGAKLQPAASAPKPNGHAPAMPELRLDGDPEDVLIAAYRANAPDPVWDKIALLISQSVQDAATKRWPPHDQLAVEVKLLPCRLRRDGATEEQIEKVLRILTGTKHSVLH